VRGGKTIAMVMVCALALAGNKKWLSFPQVCNESSESTNNDHGANDAKKADDPGNANADGGPLDPPNTLGSGEINHDQQE
jgi:hypothetical protein